MTVQTPSGTPRPITRYGTPVLHQRCAEVTEFDDALAQLVDDMFASMYAARGVGLAANQIGVNARIFVVDCPDATGKHTVAAVVNPALHLPEQRELITDHEGCLSVPGQQVEVARCATAAVTGFDVRGNAIRLEGTGTLARCFQHEYDHLEGLVYVDRLPVKLRKKVVAASAKHPGVGVGAGQTG